jgi:hypothetical protein
VEEVLELRVAEVGVDLSRVLNASSGKLEAVDSPLEVGVTLRALPERETLTEGRLIDLDDEDAVGLEVNNLVAEGESELLALYGLVDIITGERPPKAGDGTGEHALHGLLGDGSGILGLLDGHGSRARDVTDDDRGADAAGPIRLNPGVGGEDVTVEALTEVLDHVVTLGLTVDVDIKVKLILNLDGKVDLLLDEVIVLLLGDLTFGELIALDTDLAGLGERTDSGGGEKREAKMLLLLSVPGVETGLAVVLLRGNGSLALLDLGVIGAGRVGTSLDGGSVGLELGLHGLRRSDGLSEDGNLLDLLGSEREPLVDIRGELLLAGEGVGSVEEGAGCGDDDTVLTQSLDGGLENAKRLGEVILPDVSAIDDTGGEDLVGAELLDDRLELLGVADKVDMDTLNASESRDDVEVVDDVTEVGGDGDGRDSAASGDESLISGLESSLDLRLEVEDEDGLIDLDRLGTGGLEGLQELNVDGDELAKEGDGVNGRATVGLAKGEERDRTDEDGASLNASLLGLLELADGLGVLGKGESLVVLEGGLDVVVVGVKPLNHLQSGDIDTSLLVATAHGEVLIERGELLLGVAFGNGIEELNVVKNVVVVGEVVGGDDVDTGILLDLPVGETESLALGEEVILRDLASPVSLVGLLEVPKDTHTGETQDG